MNYKINYKNFIMSISIVVYLFVVLFPIIWLFSMSVKPSTEMMQIPPKWIFTPTFKHYIKLFNGAFIHYVKNSIIIALGTVFLTMIISLPAAYALSRIKFKFKSFLFTSILFSRMVPALVFIIPFYMVMKFLGLLDTHLSLIIVYSALTVNLGVWILYPAFCQFPLSLEESARIDGATVVQTFLYIAIPLIRPTLSAVSVLIFVQSWNEFMFALLLTRHNAKTLPVGIVDFISYEGINWGMVAAGSFFIMIPVIIFGIFVRKYMIGGLATGAVKG